MNTSNEEKNLTYYPWSKEGFYFYVLLLYKALNGHIHIDLTNYVQFFKESDHYMLRRKGNCTRTMQERTLLNIAILTGL